VPLPLALHSDSETRIGTVTQAASGTALQVQTLYRLLLRADTRRELNAYVS